MEDKDSLYPAGLEDITAQNNNVKEVKSDEIEEYYSLPTGSKSILKSVLSVIFAILSIALCFIWYLGVIFSVSGIVFSVLHRKQFGYFNTPSVIGLILSIFGIVFSGFAFAAGMIGLL